MKKGMCSVSLSLSDDSTFYQPTEENFQGTTATYITENTLYQRSTTAVLLFLYAVL